jgi:hypothetical protein
VDVEAEFAPFCQKVPLSKEALLRANREMSLFLEDALQVRYFRGTLVV